MSETLMEAFMSERLLLVSSDGHIGPPAERYRDYVDPKYRAEFDLWFEQYIPMWLSARAQDSVKDVPKDLMFAEAYRRHFDERAAEIPWGIEGKWDPKRRLEALDVDGVTSDVMFPDDQSANSPPFVGLARDYNRRWDNESPPELKVEGARAYNRWLAEFCSEDPDRLLGVALIGTLLDVDAAIETVTKAKGDGIGGGLLLPVSYYNNVEPFWNDRSLDPLWAACAELDMPLHTHIGPGSPYYGEDWVDGSMLWQMEASYWVHRPLWFFILSGVLERHPALKLVFTEQGAAWVIAAVRGMDFLADNPMINSGDVAGKLRLKPSEYYQRQCWIGATNTQAFPTEVDQRDAIGVDKMMWGSDYPHIESNWPHTREALRDLMKGVPESEVRAMVGSNAVTCYSLDEGRLAPIARRIGPTLDEIVTA